MKHWLGIVLAVAALASGQASSHSTKSSHTSVLPVSKYMRKMGFLYLQDIGVFVKECEDKVFINNAPAQEECSSAIREADEILDHFEGLMDIEMDGSRNRGDVMTWRLLKNARTTKANSLRAYLPSYSQDKALHLALMELWGSADAACSTYAEGAIRDGVYIEDGGCEGRIKKALNYKVPSGDPGLTAKCATFTGGSVDKVLKNEMLIPPKECREVLSWMRDGRLDRLYDGR